MSEPLDSALGTELVAFLAVSSGSGRTSGIANVAWLLAAAGRRVMVVDWSAESTSVHEYLQPFHVETAVADERLLSAFTTLVSAKRGKPPSVERHNVPGGGPGHIDVLGVPGDRAGRPAVVRRHDIETYHRIRALLQDSDYDHVLIDAPPGTDEVLAAAVAALCDTAVVCFTPRNWAISASADLADAVRAQAPTHLTIVPVVSMFDERYAVKAEQSRQAIRSAFERPLAEQRPGGAAPPEVVEIPHHSYGALYEPMLAVLADDTDDGRPSRVATAFHRLAVEVAGGKAVPRLAVAPIVRTRYRRGFGLIDQVEPDRIGVLYPPRERLWAEWVRDQLADAGVRTAGLRPGHAWLRDRPDALVVVGSPEQHGAAAERAVNGLLANPVPTDVVQVLPSGRAGVLGRIGTVISVDAYGEDAAGKRLLTHFGLVRPQGAPRTARFPASVPAIRALPPRPGHIVGRDEDLERLRESLLADGTDRATPVTVSGASGVGKSELVAEYAHRFAADYDVVWWLPAHDRESLLGGLSDLTVQLHAQGLGRIAGEDALHIDTAGTPFDRWLLVYDDIRDDTVLDLLPRAGAGHTVVTSTATAERGIVLREPSNAWRIVHRLAPDLTEVDAKRAAASVSGLPLAAEMAGHWLGDAVRRHIDQGAGKFEAAANAVEQLLCVLDEGDRSLTVPARVLEPVLSSLATTPHGRMAVRLAHLCAYLSPTGIDVDLLRSQATIDALVAQGHQDGTALQQDTLELDLILWAGTRCGLFRVEWGRSQRLRMHSTVQRLLREGLPEPDRAEARRRALACLAAFAPTEEGERTAERRARFRELQRHIGSAGALDSDSDDVRRWLVNQARFYYDGGDIAVWRTVLPQVSHLTRTWEARFGTDDPLWSRLANQLANLHRALGEHEAALNLDAKVMGIQQRTLDKAHPRTLITARGRAAGLRGLGRFADALAEDERTWRTFRDQLGGDHPSTRSAANNLALSRYLAGEQVRALRLEEENHSRLERLLGADNPLTWWSLSVIGQYAREIGEYEKATRALRLALDRVRRRSSRNDPLELRIDWYYAVTLRRQGRFRQSRDRTLRVLQGMREAKGDDHPDTIACRLSLAAEERRVDPARSVAHVRECIRKYTDVVGLDDTHPFVALCQVALGQGLRVLGDHYAAVAAAVLGRQLLTEKLSKRHPWSLAATINQGVAQAAAGQADEAGALMAGTYQQCLDGLRDKHPYSMAAKSNLVQPPVRWQDVDVDIPQT